MKSLPSVHAGPERSYREGPETLAGKSDLLLWLDAPATPVADPRARAFDLLPTPALIVNTEGTIVACNVAVSDLVGLSAMLLVGQRWWWLLTPRGNVGKNGDTHAFVLHGVDANRDVTVREVSFPHGELGGHTLLLLDEPAADERGAESDAPFLIDMVAHELRSLLLSLSLPLAGLADPTIPMERDQRSLIFALQRSAVHLQALLENVLDAASIRAGQLNMTRTATDLAAVVQEAAMVIEPLLRSHGQRIVLDLPPEPLCVDADGQHLRQVLVNLLHNAIKYGPRDETIAVCARRAEGKVEAEVTDRGPGIPEAEQQLLFERFYRGHAAAGNGSGLGLAIAKAIVGAHGGQIGVRSAPGLGSTFWFTVPAQ